MEKKEKEELLKKIEEYTKKIKEEPNNASNYFIIGKIYDCLKKYKDAYKYYDRAINLAPHKTYYYYTIALICLKLKKYKKASENFKKNLELNHNIIFNKKAKFLFLEKNATKSIYEAYLYFTNGITSFDEKNYKNAIMNFNKSIKLDPNPNKIYYYYRGSTHFYLKKYNEASDDFQKAISLYSNASQPIFENGVRYFNEKNYKNAIINFNEAIKLDPNNPSFYYFRGNTHFYLEIYDKAINDFSSAIELDSFYNKNCYYYRFIAYLNSENYDEAVKDYSEVIKLYSKITIKENINTLISDLKNIKSLYSAGDFKETKKKINSLRQYAEDLIIHLKESKAITRFSNKDTQKVLNGYLTFADILGWKGIWKKQNSDDEKVDTLNTLLFIKHKLEEEFKEEEENYKINLISDTYVIFAKNFQINNKLSKRLIELCLKNDLLIRGATSYGKFYNNDMVYIGQTVDEAASWHEMGEEIGIFYTSSAKLSINEENPIEYELKNSYLKKGTIKTKLGEMKTYYINWYSKETKKDFYRIMKDEVISPDISSKYLNTEKNIEKHLNVKSNKILRRNNYVKNR